MHAGSVHSCILTASGMVYSFGKKDYTGHGSENDVLIPAPIEIFASDPAEQVSIASGGFHTMVLTRSKHLFVWGHNRVCQLGIDSSTEMLRNADGGYYLPTPKMVTYLSSNVIKVLLSFL
jgi:alpha-tubulin suppressor-like RCC1 family protein